MSETSLALNTRLLLKHTSRTVQAKIRSLEGTVDLTSAAILPPSPFATLALNGIGLVTLETRLPLTLDLYTHNRHTGSFVLIDPQTNSTVAAGMIRSVSEAQPEGAKSTGRITPSERSTRFGHTAAHLILRGPQTLAEDIERSLFTQGANVVLLDPSSEPTITALLAAGLLVITHKPAETATLTLAGTHPEPINSPTDALAYLHHHNILQREELA